MARRNCKCAWMPCNHCRKHHVGGVCRLCPPERRTHEFV